ncbi:retrotransposon protein, putative, ty1-copia subclass [Tanacetum coccineum]
MHNMGKTIDELHALLIEYEMGLPKKGKDKLLYTHKPKNLKPSAKEHLAKDDPYHHCKEVGHWKRNCHVYLVALMKKKKQVGTASSSGIFTIELFSFPNKSWVYDTGCGTHICNTKQGLKGKRKLKQGVVYLYVGNSVRAQVEAIESFDLVLPNGLVICLDNCHYAPTITRGVVLVSHLVDNGFIQYFTNYGISVSKNNVLYFNVIPQDESTTRILNMVPTKKVDKKPYELWYGKVPNLSYLKDTMGYYFFFPPENKIVVASEIPAEVEGFEPPQEEIALVRRLLGVNGFSRTDMDVNVHTYKARLVAKIYTQTYRIDYEETFSPIADIRAIRILLAIAAFYDYKIWQMDVKTTFLNGYLDEDIYIVQPEGFIDPKHPRKYASFKDPFID